MTESTGQRGFTLIEVVISLGLLMVIVVALLGLSIETASFIGSNDVEMAVQLEGQRSFNRLTEILRKSGRVVDGATTYPRVVDAGAALEFRVLQDIDGNGYAFDQATGDLEWSPNVFTLKLDPDGNLRVYNGPTVVYHLGRHVENMEFETILENSTLHLNEISATYQVQKPSRPGVFLVHTIKGSIHMRN
ncbi:MAG: prepilin-type N-terminal cleavage/methylation domain-containing protein [Planctomycetota bacterium]|nr:prepilin-type N-terminal cleavage/methylation domain-containing protein [Planctomycetota bacterium]